MRGGRVGEGRGGELSLKALKIISGESCAHVIHGGVKKGRREENKGEEGGRGGDSLRGLLNFDNR